MTKNIVLTGITPKSYLLLLDTLIDGEGDPRALELWKQAQAALATGGPAAAQPVMRQAEGVSTHFRVRTKGGYQSP